MKISTKALWIAIHRVFARERIGTGCSIDLGFLMSAWGQSGIRQSDLATGLESLVQAGFVSLEMAPGGPCVRLLDEQFGLLGGAEQERADLAALDELLRSRTRATAFISGQVRPPANDRRAADRYPYAPIAQAA